MGGPTPGPGLPPSQRDVPSQRVVEAPGGVEVQNALQDDHIAALFRRDEYRTLSPALEKAAFVREHIQECLRRVRLVVYAESPTVVRSGSQRGVFQAHRREVRGSLELRKEHGLSIHANDLDLRVETVHVRTATPLSAVVRAAAGVDDTLRSLGSEGHAHAKTEHDVTEDAVTAHRRPGSGRSSAEGLGSHGPWRSERGGAGSLAILPIHSALCFRPFPYPSHRLRLGQTAPYLRCGALEATEPSGASPFVEEGHGREDRHLRVGSPVPVADGRGRPTTWNPGGGRR